MVGTLDSYDTIARALANRSQSVVVSVDYRLAPEHSFPAAADDAMTALRWVQTHASELGSTADRVAVVGDSAGGNLAAVVAQRHRDSGGVPLVMQGLIYPVTDAAWDRWSAIPETGNQTAELIRLFAAYAGGADREDPAMSPLRARDLHGLPPALIITAEYDQLRDQGEEYGRRMSAAGVDVVVHRYPGMPHGFWGMRVDVDAAESAMRELGTALQHAFAGVHRAGAHVEGIA